VVEGVRRVYPGPIVALDGVSLTLEPGEFIVLTGPSGSGKTSLLSIIGDLDRPTSGTVEVDGVVTG
jgi:putative ABC transport system ATP-binding protein